MMFTRKIGLCCRVMDTLTMPDCRKQIGIPKVLGLYVNDISQSRIYMTADIVNITFTTMLTVLH